MAPFVRQYDALIRNRERKRQTLHIEDARMTGDGRTSPRAEEERGR
jgi:hypothetical protein